MKSHATRAAFTAIPGGPAVATPGHPRPAAATGPAGPAGTASLGTSAARAARAAVAAGPAVVVVNAVCR